MFVMIFALEKFRSYLLDTNVIVYTDRTSLRYLMNKRMLNQGLDDGYIIVRV